jgi:hypothetical protein
MGQELKKVVWVDNVVYYWRRSGPGTNERCPVRNTWTGRSLHVHFRLPDNDAWAALMMRAAR